MNNYIWKRNNYVWILPPRKRIDKKRGRATFQIRALCYRPMHMLGLDAAGRKRAD